MCTFTRFILLGRRFLIKYSMIILTTFYNQLVELLIWYYIIKRIRLKEKNESKQNLSHAI